MRKVAFVGAGNIGLPTAERFLTPDYDLIVCDRTQAVLDRFAAKGARTTGKVSECAGEAVVLVMVQNDAQLTDCILGPSGLLAAQTDRWPEVVIILSTVAPQTVIDLAARLAEKGIRTIDSPVAGGAYVAARGELTLMIGGSDADVEHVKDVLDRISKTIFRCGGLGSGETAKLLNNLVAIANNSIMVDVYNLAKRCDVDLPWITSVMENGTGRNFFTADWERTRGFFSLLDENTFHPTMTKDLKLVMGLAASKNVELPVAAALTDVVSKLPPKDLFRMINDFLS